MFVFTTFLVPEMFESQLLFPIHVLYFPLIAPNWTSSSFFSPRISKLVHDTLSSCPSAVIKVFEYLFWNKWHALDYCLYCTAVHPGSSWHLAMHSCKVTFTAACDRLIVVLVLTSYFSASKMFTGEALQSSVMEFSELELTWIGSLS